MEQITYEQRVQQMAQGYTDSWNRIRGDVWGSMPAGLFTEEAKLAVAAQAEAIRETWPGHPDACKRVLIKNGYIPSPKTDQ